MDSFIADLRRIVGNDHVSVSLSSSEVYSYDASLVRGRPGVVVFPGDTQQAARVVRAAHNAGIVFVPRGFGTNLSGGTVLQGGGLVISLTRFNRVLGIFPGRRCALVQPGVTNLELQNALAPIGFFYAPDPASQKVATLGGNVAENSGGPRCLKYGVTTNHVLGLEVILPEGDVVRMGGEALDTPGYDLRGVMVGSEGTLGVVTEVTVRILPKPEAVITLLAIYDGVSEAAQSVSDIISAGIVPATLEMMDAPIIKAVEDSYACGYPRDAAAVLIIEVEGPLTGLKAQAQRIRDLCEKNHCRTIREAKDNEERNRLWEGRRGAFGAVARLAPNYLVNDCTVPRTQLPKALALVAEICRKYGFEHGNVFHAGDGNLHPLLFFDSRDPHQLHRVHEAGWEIMQACVDLGGTITGEHGVGLEKKAAMRLVFTEHDFAAQRALKAAFDPRDLMNPGKIIPAKEDEGREETDPVPEGGEALILEGVRAALRSGGAILPVGQKTCHDFGNRASTDPVEIQSTGLADVFDLDPANQVVTAGAGMVIGTLQMVLRDHGQWLPIRPPLAVLGHSLGGMVALGASGPERLAYGAPRDLLLGMRLIDGRGAIIQCGGRVVKNVAGYDMTRLMTGSAGTLGFFTRLTFRTASIPERCTALTARGSVEACSLMAMELLQSTLSPIFVIAAADGGEDSSQWMFSVGYEGFSGTVADQLMRCSERLKRMGFRAVDQQDYPVLTGFCNEWYRALDRLPFLLRADLPLDRLIHYIHHLKDGQEGAFLMLDFGCGRMLAGREDLTPDAWTFLCDRAAAFNGHIILMKAPPAFKHHHDVFGGSRPEWQVTHRIKDLMDPQGIFAPGRLPGRI